MRIRRLSHRGLLRAGRSVAGERSPPATCGPNPATCRRVLASSASPSPRTWSTTIIKTSSRTDASRLRCATGNGRRRTGAHRSGRNPNDTLTESAPLPARTLTRSSPAYGRGTTRAARTPDTRCFPSSTSPPSTPWLPPRKRRGSSSDRTRKATGSPSRPTGGPVASSAAGRPPSTTPRTRPTTGPTRCSCRGTRRVPHLRPCPAYRSGRAALPISFPQPIQGTPVFTRSVRARHIRNLGSGRRTADAVRTSDLVLAVAGVATLGGFCLLLAADLLSDLAGSEGLGRGSRRPGLTWAKAKSASPCEGPLPTLSSPCTREGGMIAQAVRA